MFSLFSSKLHKITITIAWLIMSNVKSNKSVSHTLFQIALFNTHMCSSKVGYDILGNSKGYQGPTWYVFGILWNSL